MEKKKEQGNERKPNDKALAVKTNEDADVIGKFISDLYDPNKSITGSLLSNRTNARALVSSVLPRQDEVDSLDELPFNEAQKDAVLLAISFFRPLLLIDQAISEIKESDFEDKSTKLNLMLSAASKSHTIGKSLMSIRSAAAKLNMLQSRLGGGVSEAARFAMEGKKIKAKEKKKPPAEKNIIDGDAPCYSKMQIKTPIARKKIRR